MTDIAPLVSVIVPVYNSERFLRQCLDSIVNQTLRNIEIICVNDGSTDNSLKMLNDYVANDGRVRVFTKPNEGKGAASARNLGMELAQGKYLSFLDSDDFFELDMLETMSCRAEETSADIVVCSGVHYDNKTEKTAIIKHFLNSEHLPEKDVFSYKDCAESIYQITDGAAWCKLYQRAFLEKSNLKFQRINYTDDAYFCFAQMVRAERIVTVNKPFVYYRVNIGTSQSDGITRYPDSAYLPYTALKQSLVEWGIYEQVKRSFVNVAAAFMRSCYDKVSTFQSFEYLHDKYRNELFEKLDIAGQPRSYFYDERLYDWYRQVSETSAADMAFRALRSYSDYFTTGILRFQFPYDLIEHGSNIVLYGSGLAARYYFAQLLLSEYAKVVLWTEGKSHRNNDYYDYLKDPMLIHETSYDAVLIAYASNELIQKAKEYLLELGIPAKKIIHKMEGGYL